MLHASVHAILQLVCSFSNALLLCEDNAHFLFSRLEIIFVRSIDVTSPKEILERESAQSIRIIIVV